MLIDAHAHFDRYAERLDEALAQINYHRILTIAVSMDVASYLKTASLAPLSPYLKPTFGVHPWEAVCYCERLNEMDQYLALTPLIGEAGLDYHWVEDKNTYPCQRKVFEYQCDWAGRTGKIMNLHTKGAEQDVLRAIDEFRLNGPVIHWYSGPTALIDAYVARGSYFTVGVETLVSEEARATARAIPVERLLLETDNPGGWEWLTREIGMPELVLRLLREVAELKGMLPAELERQLSDNWSTLTRGIEGLGEPKE